MDIYSQAKRSDVMSRVRANNSSPELIVRRTLHALGYRYRLHRKTLPGKPDIVLAKYKSIIFVHGCFWHHHEGCKKSKLPTSNEAFWRKKIMDNVARDQEVIHLLTKSGWKVMIIWECEIDSQCFPDKLLAFLGRNYEH